MSELSDAQCDRLIAAIKHHPASIAVLDALWELHDTIDDPFDAGWLSGLIETLEGNPPYTTWPPPAPGSHSTDYRNPPRLCPCIATDFQPPNGQTIHEHNDEYVNAARWSRGE